MSEEIEKLAEYFMKFPGIGKRQSKRFVHFILQQNDSFANSFADLVKNINKNIVYCSECFRFHEVSNENKICELCMDDARDKSILMIVERDMDLENIEKNDVFNGHYFVLGGTVPILDSEPEKRIKAQDLVNTVNKRALNSIPLKEIVLATSLNPEGENTTVYVNKLLAPLVETHSIKMSVLGRGLSTGTELEYSDKETLKNALSNRT